jgi:hypothetical protein
MGYQFDLPRYLTGKQRQRIGWLWDAVWSASQQQSPAACRAALAKVEQQAQVLRIDLEDAEARELAGLVEAEARDLRAAAPGSCLAAVQGRHKLLMKHLAEACTAGR